MRRAQQGDEGALESLLRRHYDSVHAVCRRITGDDEDAVDAAQEAMIAIVRGLPRFDGRSALSTWIYRIATNASLDELRRRRRRPVPERGRHVFDGDAGPAEPRAAGDLAAMVTARLTLDEALASLPPDQRAAVVLRDLADLDYAEIAETLQIPIGTVRSRIARGHAALAAMLGEEPEPSSWRQTEKTDG